MAVLQQRTNGGSRRLHTLTRGTTRIGRPNECELFLNAQDVSRFHARILYEDEQYLIEDLGSRNGTQLNGQTIDQQVVLRNGDRLQFPSLEFTYFSERPLNDDSSLSHQPPSVITLQTGSMSASDATPPLAVREGDRISPDLMVQCVKAGHDGLADRLMTSIHTTRESAPLQDDVALLTIHRTDAAPADSSTFRLPQEQTTK